MFKEKLQDNEMLKSPNFEAFFTRHGAALYREHEKVLSSNTPEERMNSVEALRPDLDPERINDVSKAANDLLSNLNPETDELFIVSGDLPRVLETANIYREIAHEKGFVITGHGERSRNEYANELAGGEIRVLDNLRIEVENLVTLSVFHPDVENQNIDWDSVSDDTKTKWKSARKIIEEDDRGDWGENFVAHVDEIGELFPDVLRAKHAYQRQFENLMKLAKFGAGHSLSTQGRQIKVLAFGHENYIRLFLDEYFDDLELNNVETIKLEIGNDLKVTRRGVSKTIGKMKD